MMLIAYCVFVWVFGVNNMPVFEIFNPDGSLQFDMSNRLSKYLGYIQIQGNTPGSLLNPRFTEAIPWYTVTPSIDFNPATGRVPSNPTVTFIQGTMSWSGGTGGVSYIITYGVY